MFTEVIFQQNYGYYSKGDKVKLPSQLAEKHVSENIAALAPKPPEKNPEIPADRKTASKKKITKKL